MGGLHNDFVNFITFLFLMILCSTAATSLALMIAAYFKTSYMALKVLCLCLEVCRLFGGFFLEPAKLPKYYSWLDSLSFYKYAFISVANNEYKNIVFTCKSTEMLSDGSCPIKDGNYIRYLRGYD